MLLSISIQPDKVLVENTKEVLSWDLTGYTHTERVIAQFTSGVDIHTEGVIASLHTNSVIAEFAEGVDIHTNSVIAKFTEEVYRDRSIMMDHDPA